METITIPKELAAKDDLIIIPRKHYEEFLEWQKLFKQKRTFRPTQAEKKALQRARKNFIAGKYLTLEQLKNELGINY